MNRFLLPILPFLFFLLSFSATAGDPCPAGCDQDPLCVQEDMCFRIEYFGARDQGNGTTQLKFRIYNSSRFSFNSVTFELPGVNQPAITPAASYISRFHYSVQNTFADSLIKFTGLNTGAYRYDQADVFRYTVDSATFHNGFNSTIQVIAKAGILTGKVTFNLEECEDMPLFPLPVELTSFTGKATSEGVALNWATATEKNNAYFSIQYSTDGRNFESVGYVEGKGTTTSSNAYSFTHKDAKPGKGYYRLKQVDHDLTTAYSQIIVIESKAKATMPLQVYPNPVTGGEVTLRMENTAAEKVSISLTDLNGRSILNQTVASEREVKLNLQSLNLKPGIYILHAQSGLQTAQQKLIVQ